MQTEEFDTHLLVRHKKTELLNQIVYIRQQYAEFLAEAKQTHISTLEDKLDSLIEQSRLARANADKVHGGIIEELRQEANAESAMRNADNLLAQFHYRVRNNKGLLTKAEIAEEERQLEEYKQRAHEAALAYSSARTGLRLAYQREQEAINAAANAEAAARACRAELDVATGVKKVIGSGGFYIS